MDISLTPLLLDRISELGAIIHNRSVKERRPFGAYYTPRAVTDILAKWAIRSPEELILEPGFGGCGFIEASLARIDMLGAVDPFAHIYGCDNDPAAFSILGHKLGGDGHEKRFLHSDFLHLHPNDFAVVGFDVVIGNPPYVSLHAMSGEQREVAAGAMLLDQFPLDKRASLWAYFVLHALMFLRQGGRCAWVLPSSYLYADYARDVRIHLKDRFSRVVEITMEQRLFSSEGAKERTVIVLADGYLTRSGEKNHRQFHVENADELEGVVSSFENDYAGSNGGFASPTSDAAALFDALRGKLTCRALGDFIDVRIGIVTGANDFFIRSEATWLEFGIKGAEIRPILSKLNQVMGLEFTKIGLETNRQNGLKCMLLNIGELGRKSKKVSQYLASFPPDKMAANATFKKRAYWYSPDDGRVPDAFLSYMCDHGPRLVLNQVKTTSTNTIHRVYFHADVDLARKKAIAISMLTTVTQLSAELVGRSYGSGVLKLEPGEARRIDIVLPDTFDMEVVIKTFDVVDNLLREGKGHEARQVADALFLAPQLDDGQIALLDTVLTRLRAIRREPRMKV